MRPESEEVLGRKRLIAFVLAVRESQVEVEKLSSESAHCAAADGD